MRLADAASAIARWWRRDYYIYYGRDDEYAPGNVTRVIIHSSVRAIRDYAFRYRSELRIVILNDGLEEIGKEAFADCTSLRGIVIPNAVEWIHHEAFLNCNGAASAYACWRRQKYEFEGEYFIYYGREGERVPRDVTHVKIHSSARAIKEGAFFGCGQLRIVILNEGLEEIGREAFIYCESLRGIVIPNAVKTIEGGAFNDCTGMTDVTLGEGLEEIEEYAFSGCTSLRGIIIPNAVKRIEGGAFSSCTGMMNVILGEGLEEIEEYAFSSCDSLERICIPPAVKYIHHSAFERCSNLTHVQFCNQIENFVSCEAMRSWWDRGLHEKCLRTYCFLVEYRIPDRLQDLARVSGWQVNIHRMLMDIPTISSPANDSSDDDDHHFDTIGTKITIYENLLNEGPMLFPRRLGLNDDIVLNILSFL